MNRNLIFPCLLVLLFSCQKNHAPLIHSVVYSPNEGKAGTIYTLGVIATDPDGDKLQYLWMGDEGAFIGPTDSAQTKWQSPVSDRDLKYSLKVTVSDGIAIADKILDINVKPRFGSFTDIRDGKAYKTIEIGTQTWMAENLAYLSSVSFSSNASVKSPLYYVYGYEGTDTNAAKANTNYATYGVLYNWEAAKTACPVGWHLPTDNEWKTLEMYLGMSQSDADALNERESGSVGKSLKATSGWSDDYNGDNKSGFTALPGGGCANDKGFIALGTDAYFWSVSKNTSYAWFRFLFSAADGVFRGGIYDLSVGFSVRCVMGPGLPIVTTTAISGITQTTAASGGNITSSGGTTITARGVCWSTSSDPSIADNKTNEGPGSGSFTSYLTELTAGTEYHVRAYATNSAGTDYGEEKLFTTTFIGGGSFTDPRDSKEYKTIKIGTQNWMAENLAYLPAVRSSSNGSNTSPYYYVFDYEGAAVSAAKATINYSIYGVLYNWEAAKTACPSGWHLPSDDEWKTLEKYLGMSNSDADASYVVRLSGNVGDKLKESGNNHWIGGNSDRKNSSGFTGLPGGERSLFKRFDNLGWNAKFWSSSENSSYAWYRELSGSSGVTREADYREIGYSVRCLQN